MTKLGCAAIPECCLGSPDDRTEDEDPSHELEEGRFVHTIPGQKATAESTWTRSQSAGYRPHRKTARRRPR
jgi:hypothetical protein